MFTRKITKCLEGALFKGKAVVLYGPRQVGKTTLLKSLFGDSYKGKRVQFVTCDDPYMRSLFTNKSAEELRSVTRGTDILILDEAQLVGNIGITIKLFVDNIKELQVVATGSSSFDLANKIVEPLTGRVYELSMYGLSYNEIEESNGVISAQQSLARILQTGTYPEVFTSTEPLRQLPLLSGSFLYKDILAYEGIRRPDVLEKILTVLARATGNTLSIQSIANDVDANQRTVINYLYLLEQAHIIFTLGAIDGNDVVRMKKKKKYYITDTGIRNTFLSGIDTPMMERHDKGQLFESFCIMERVKYHVSNGRVPKLYYYRDDAQREVDLIDLTAGHEGIYEFTIEPEAAKNKKFPAVVLQEFPNLTVHVVHRENVHLLYTNEARYSSSPKADSAEA